MTKPTLTSAGERLYDGLIPFNDSQGVDGESTGWSLAYYAQALGSMIQRFLDLSQDTEAGDPGWSVLLDLDRADAETLPYMAQFIGEQLDPKITFTEQVEQVRNHNNFNRGSVAHFTSILNVYTALNGDIGWLLRERYDPDDPLVDHAYSFEVIIYTDDLTPTNDLTLAALQAIKPAGLVMHYTRASGVDWQYVKDNYASWNTVKTSLTDWTAVRDL